jgi:hypothetical protein
MPQRRKSYRDRTCDRSFLARRHAELLAEGPLHDEPYVARFQRRYRAAKSQDERYGVALELAAPRAESRLHALGGIPSPGGIPCGSRGRRSGAIPRELPSGVPGV